MIHLGDYRALDDCLVEASIGSCISPLPRSSSGALGISGNSLRVIGLIAVHHEVPAIVQRGREHIRLSLSRSADFLRAQSAAG